MESKKNKVKPVQPIKPELRMLQEVVLKGETIKETFFFNYGGSSKMFMIFKSGKIVVLPVTPDLRVQEGVISDLVPDLNEFRKMMLAQQALVNRGQADLFNIFGNLEEWDRNVKRNKKKAKKTIKKNAQKKKVIEKKPTPKKSKKQ